VDVLYILRGTGASAGTRRSAIRSLATSWISYQDGGWQGTIPGGQVRRFSVPERTGGMQTPYALRFPSCEAVTVPANLPVRSVTTWMSTAPSARFWAPLVIPLLARLSRSILGPLAVRLAGSGGLRAGQPQRQDDSFTIVVTATRGKQSNSLVLAGSDVYGLTAEIIAYFACAMLKPDFQQAGVLSPAQAVDPAAFLKTAEVEWNVTRIKGGSANGG
jgi:hypothetical protein